MKSSIMKKVIAILLIVAAVVLGYLGITGLSQSEKSVDLLGLEITAQDSETKQTAYIELALGVVALVGGIYLLGQLKKK